MEHIRQFIDNLAAGNNTEAKESIENAISAKAFDILDAYKTQIAQGIFNSDNEETNIEVQDSESE
jgi:hypothetical protein